MNINTETTWCFTGHRPDKLYGYDKNSEGNVYLRNAINDSIKYLHVLHGIDTFISGMALGWDMWAAEEVLELQKILNIKLVCAIPCKGHSDKFSKQDKEDYLHIIYNANYVHNITGIKYFPRCMQIRDEWMVNNSSGQIAGWDGTRGGTYNTLMYANKVNKTNRIVINPLTMNVQFLGV